MALHHLYPSRFSPAFPSESAFKISKCFFLLSRQFLPCHSSGTPAGSSKKSTLDNIGASPDIVTLLNFRIVFFERFIFTFPSKCTTRARKITMRIIRTRCSISPSTPPQGTRSLLWHCLIHKSVALKGSLQTKVTLTIPSTFSIKNPTPETERQETNEKGNPQIPWDRVEWQTIWKMSKNGWWYNMKISFVGVSMRQWGASFNPTIMAVISQWDNRDFKIEITRRNFFVGFSYTPSSFLPFFCLLTFSPFQETRRVAVEGCQPAVPSQKLSKGESFFFFYKTPVHSSSLPPRHFPLRGFHIF